MIKVVKASAGSGKTYTLAHKYIDLLLAAGREHAYRNILAVTFTNKATAEMKARILRELHESPSADANKMLVDILHDYSAFAVSTIDKFFQQALKAFSREIGQFASYQIELDKKALIAEAVDRILDSLTEEDAELLDWLKTNALDQLREGKKVDLGEALYSIGNLLKTDEHRSLSEEFGIDPEVAFSKDRLRAIHNECRDIFENFRLSVMKAAAEVQPSLKGKNALKQIGAYLDIAPGAKIDFPKSSLYKDAEGSTFNYLFDTEYDKYNTAVLVESQLFNLGIAGEFYKEFTTLLKEKNILCLDESNTILRDIIDGSDAPFVYEKLGVRYENFLLDEFQDTADIQWANFLPLLRESDSNGRESLIVGDVKQSIYRWRGSQWKLLGEQVAQDFPNADVSALKFNWRSCGTIVDFNNDFFQYAASVIGRRDIYDDDLIQGVKSSDPQQGFVQVDFCEPGDQESLILDSVNAALESGAEYGDIAILVRDHKVGASVAEALVGANIPVVSDDSLRLSSSVVVRRLISLLKCVENPDDEVNSFYAKTLEIEFPQSFHSLVDLCEDLLRKLKDFDPLPFEGETLFIQTFLDDIQSFTNVYGNNLRNYLKHLDESDPAISSPESEGSVKIITVHKSKGLEFPYVIVPYVEKITRYRGETHWCHLDAKAAGLPEVFEGNYPVSLESTCEKSFFRDALEAERRMQDIDNINVLYVALTRARNVLHIIAESPSKTFLENYAKGKHEYGNFAQMLYSYCGAEPHWSIGTPYVFAPKQKADVMTADALSSNFASWPLGGRLAPSVEAADFFGEDGSVGASSSHRREGIILHDILSKVQQISDVAPAVREAAIAGLLSEDEARGAETLLRSAVSSHPEWFNADVYGRNEVSVIGEDGQFHRPDRVVVSGDNICIVDYKFGEHKNAYIKQVRRYIELYRRMGYENVSGAIWYVREDKVESV